MAWHRLRMFRRSGVPLFLLLSAGLGLGGCATVVNGPTRLMGENLDAATALYGPWTQEIYLQGRTLYIWRRKLITPVGDRFCEMRVQLGFRQTIARAYLQGFPDACKLFAVRYQPETK